MKTIINPHNPFILVEELSDTMCSFKFPKAFAEIYMDAILDVVPEARFCVAEPEDFSDN